jgi:hypothetical protein
MTTAKKQRIEPSYTPKTYTEEEREEARLRSRKNIPKIKEQVKNRRACNIRYYKVQQRWMAASMYKRLGKMRTCIDCKVEMAASWFDYHDYRKHGAPRKSYCFKCRQKRNAADYDANKAKIKEKSRLYYEKNKEKRKQQFKENYQRRAYGHITKGSESE